MLKFFRNIRKILLSEGKTTKYLKYAIGEIVLVVAGILIALQVNNWNENRKQKQIEIAALAEVRDDLVNSMWDINQNLTLMRDWLESAWKVKRHINNSEVFADSLGFDLLNLTRDEYLLPTSKTYSGLRYAGFKVIKNDDIRLKLDELYEVLFPRLQANTSIEPDIQAYFSNYISKNFRAVSIDTLYNSGIKVKDLNVEQLIRRGWGYYSKYIPIDYNHFRNDPEFSVLLDNSIRWRMLKIMRYINTKERTDETLDLIEKNIKGKIKLSPIRSLSSLISKEKDIDKIIDIIKIGNTDEQSYDISESSINRLGWTFVEQNRITEALKIFKLNTELYPNGFNTYNSYGEILLKTGDKENAIKAFEKTLELNPNFEFAKKMLSKIK